MDLSELTDADLVDVLGTLEDLEGIELESPAVEQYPVLRELEGYLALSEAVQ